eukprot:1629935-Rhodomonas_salina.2
MARPITANLAPRQRRVSEVDSDRWRQDTARGRKKGGRSGRARNTHSTASYPHVEAAVICFKSNSDFLIRASDAAQAKIAIHEAILFWSNTSYQRVCGGEFAQFNVTVSQA